MKSRLKLLKQLDAGKTSPELDTFKKEFPHLVKGHKAVSTNETKKKRSAK